MQKFIFITELDSPERADKFLHTLFQEQEGLEHLSRSQIQKHLELGSILVNKQKISAKDKIPLGSEISVEIAPPTQLEALPENIPLQILYEDEHLVVINKQPGLTVHPSDTQASGTMVNALLYHIKDLSGIGGKLRPGIVHRIDKDTSGAIVVSKNDLTHQGLSKLFATHDIKRKYWAICYGAPQWTGDYTFESTIGRNPNDRKKMAVNVQGGRSSISHFQLLEEFAQPTKNPFASLIQATLQTGRTHQVRVHLNHLGYSLLGDPIYGTPTSHQPKWKALPNKIQKLVEQLPGQALHARVLGFVHPITQKELYFEAEPFREFGELLETLKSSQK